MPEVVVVGGGVAGLVAARDLAIGGLTVTVLEAAAHLGGCVAPLDVAGLRVDAGAESFATRTTAVADLLGELGLGDEVVAPAGGGAWVQLPDGAVPLPRGGLLGIPASVRTAEVRRVVGRRGVLRGSLDRVLPARVGLGPASGLRWGADGVSLGHVVRVRLGARILERLVAPVVTGVHSVHPDLLDLDAVLPTGPSLRERLLRHGSLTAAVASLRPAAASGRPGPGTGDRAVDRTAVAPGSAVAGLVGGMHRLVTALTEDLTRRGVTLRTGSPVTGLHATEGRWTVRCADGTELTADVAVLAVPAPAPLLPTLPTLPTTPTSLTTLSVAELARGRSATDNPTERGRRSGPRSGPGEGPGDGPGEGPRGGPGDGPGGGIVLVTVVLDAPGLDVAPRGTGVLVAAGVPGVRAKALTHASAKWPWLAQAAGAGRHVVRLSYNLPGPDGTALPDGGALLDLAVADASRLLGVPLHAGQVVGWARTDWPGGLHRPEPAPGSVASAEEGSAGTAPPVHVTGAVVAGTGLATVVQHARTTAAAVGRGDRERTAG